MRREDAEASFARALALNPALAGAQASRGHALIHLRRNREAIAQFRGLEARDPAVAAVGLLSAAQPICDWDTIEAVGPKVAQMAAGGEAPVTPFQMLVSFSDPKLLRDATRFRRATLPPTAPPPPLRPADGRIRLAYLSADFHSHATAHLMADLFERHDRRRFDVIGISFGADTGGAMRQRLERGFDRFLDVREKSDADIAALLRQMPIDIAVDLKGYTQDARPAIFAHRPAPVQVSYLGYPGMMAADCYDYVLGDPVVLPHAQQPYWDEKIVHLPDSYQCNDPARAHPASMSRAEAGLPQSGFVFASFNNHFKIDRPFFESWMRLLAANPGSLLWLLDDSANDELRAHARARGIDPARLVFAPKLDIASHLRRLPLIDVMLDTLPCGAHTTASDALWMGVPMLTCLGQSFAGRVAASLLTALRCPELIAHTLDEYEALALDLARNGQKLDALKAKIAANRLTAPLFDAARFCRHIERAYRTMMDLARAGVPPKAFDVPVIEG
jgi:predicted O-linked N-acetylglucosamine transferase (SPINDLY family)